MRRLFFVVINHYATPGAPAFLAASTIFSAALSVGQAGVTRVLVVDGSAAPDPELRRGLAAVGADYLHEGRRLGFSEGYNAGLARSDQPWTILCASDVYPSLTFYDYLARFCLTPQAQAAGCLVPQLSFSDLAVQAYSRIKAPIAIPLMTLNCNVFDTAYLRALGGVPQEFNGYYNDVVLARRHVRGGTADPAASREVHAFRIADRRLGHVPISSSPRTGASFRRPIRRSIATRACGISTLPASRTHSGSRRWRGSCGSRPNESAGG